MAHRALVVFIILLGIFCSRESYAQPNKPASVFDKDCYFPVLDDPSQIDSIYGSKSQQFLGRYLKNIGPKKGESYGQIMVYGLPENPLFLNTISTGPSFDLHHRKDLTPFPLSKILFQEGWRFGHFRSKKYQDILTEGLGTAPRIFWADENGDYDTNRFTMLEYSKFNDSSQGYGGLGLVQPYSTFLSSDTVEDIIYGCNPNSIDTQLLLYFKGGEELYLKGVRSKEDSAIFLTKPNPGVHGRTSSLGVFQADFRGTGRADLIIADCYNNLLFYKNDPPFSLSNFKYEIQNDTLLSKWDNPRMDTSNTSATGAIVGNPGTWSIFPKAPDDKSVDFFISAADKYASDMSDTLGGALLCYQGGPNFGSKRLKIENSDFLIVDPEKNGFAAEIGWGEGLENCGDMSGKGFPLLRVEANSLGGSFYFFYQTGKALDSKAGMFYDLGNNGYAKVDTLIGDEDQFSDLLLGISGFYDEADRLNGNFGVGSVHLLHGTDKIPAHLNPKYSVVQKNTIEANLIVSPNPVQRKAKVQFFWQKDENIQVLLHDILGRIVFRDYISASVGEQIFQLQLPQLPDGTYILELLGNSSVQNKTIIIMQ